MPPALPLYLPDEYITRAAKDMIRIYGKDAVAKAEEYVDGLNSEGSQSLAKTWELIRDRITELQEADR